MDAELKAFQLDYRIFVDPDWFKQCVAFLEGEVPLIKNQKEKLHNMVYQQVLLADFNIMGSGCLPRNICDMAKGVLQGKFVVQVDEIITISDSYENWYKDGENRMLKLSITDGKQRIFGMEYERIPELSVSTSPGIKIAIGNVTVRRGMLLLTPNNTRLIGGQVETLVEQEKKKRQQWENRNKGTFLPTTTNADDTTRQMQNNKITAISKTQASIDDDDFADFQSIPNVPRTTSTRPPSYNPSNVNNKDTGGNVTINYGGTSNKSFDNVNSFSGNAKPAPYSSFNPSNNKTNNTNPPNPVNLPKVHQTSNPTKAPNTTNTPSTTTAPTYASEFDDFLFDDDFIDIPPKPSAATTPTATTSNALNSNATTKVPPPPSISTPSQTPRPKLSLSLSRSKKTPLKPPIADQPPSFTSPYSTVQSIPASPLASSPPASPTLRRPVTLLPIKSETPIVLESPEPPFVYIHDLQRTNKLRTVLIKAAVIEVIPGFQFRSSYSLEVRIDDGSAIAIASLSSNLITGLIGISCDEFRKRFESSLPQHKADIAERSKAMEGALAAMEGVMTVQIEPASPNVKYTVLDIRNPTSGQVQEMYNYLTMR